MFQTIHQGALKRLGVCDEVKGGDVSAGAVHQNCAVAHKPSRDRLIEIRTGDAVNHDLERRTRDETVFRDQAAVGYGKLG